MNTIHQANIEGCGSLVLTRERAGSISIHLRAPEEGPNRNPPMNNRGKLIDHPEVCRISENSVDGLAEYLNQFSKNKKQDTEVAAKELFFALRAMVGVEKTSEIRGMLEVLEKAIPLNDEEKHNNEVAKIACKTLLSNLAYAN